MIVERLNAMNGFDTKDYWNAKQNNNTEDLIEFKGYIYVVTSKNYEIRMLDKVLKIVKEAGGKYPISIDIKEGEMDNNAEIWRYKKDGALDWQRVYKNEAARINKFTKLIKHKSRYGHEVLYVVGVTSEGSKILKSTDGSNWTEVGYEKDKNNIGKEAFNKYELTIMSHNGKIYVGNQDKRLLFNYNNSNEQKVDNWNEAMNVNTKETVIYCYED